MKPFGNLKDIAQNAWLTAIRGVFPAALHNKRASHNAVLIPVTEQINVPLMTRMPESETRVPLDLKGHRLVVNAFTTLLCCILTIQVSHSFAGTKPKITAEQIVEKADRIRFPAETFQVDVAITTTGPEQDPEVRKYRILSKGNNRTLLMTTYPDIERGTILLMRDNDLWTFLPSLSQPVRLPLSQRLTGQVANGDLARANFAGDYTPKLLRNEEIEGQRFYVLELTAARRGVTYHRVLYWVNQNSYRPYKAQFFTLSGRHMKTAYYDAFKYMEGSDRPTQLVMEDAMREGERSVLVYSNMRLRNLPEKVFTKEYLNKLGK